MRSVTPQRPPAACDPPGERVRRLWCRTCGDLALYRTPSDDSPLMDAGKPLAILVYLALAPRQRAGRDHVAELMWPGTDLTDARHSLRQALYRLRQAVGGMEVVEASDNDLELSPVVELDCLVAERALAGGDAPQALGKLRGNFLEGFSLPESREFESWAESQRVRFRETWSRAAQFVAEDCLRSGETNRALAIAEELSRELPFDDGPMRLVMSGLAALGRHASAVARFHAYAELLRKEEEEEPGAELTAYAGELEAFLRSRPEPIRAALPLVGRSAQWAVLEAAWSAARDGRGGTVLVEGVPGLGKSRLLEELATRVATAGGVLLSAKCYEIEQMESYGAVAEALRAISGRPDLASAGPACIAEASRLLPELGEGQPAITGPANPLSPQAATRRLHHAVARCIEAVAARTPALLALDDLHWADEESLAFLHYLVHRLHGTGVLILGTFRPGELAPPARRFTRALCSEGLAQLVVLEPLAERDVVALLEGQGRFDDDGAAAVAWHLHRHTGGNPLFIAETLDALDRSGVLSIKEGHWRFSGSGAMEDLPRTLGALIDNRVTRLAPWVRSCVEMLAVSGQELPVEAVARAVRMSESRVELAFGVLMEERLVRRVGAALYEMAHDELRRLVCEPISETRQADLRTCLGKALESEGERTNDREAMTPKRGQSAKAPTSNVEAYGLWLEGRSCLNQLGADALVRSVGCFERAIALDPDYALAYVGLADAYVRMAVFGPRRPHEVCPKAKAAARQALALDGALAEAHTSLAWVSFIYDWNWEEAEQRFRRALELSPGYPVALQGYAHLLCSLGRHGEALDAVTRILDLGPLGPGFLGLVLFLARRYDEAMAALRRSLEIDPGYFQARVTLPWVYTAAGRYEEAVVAGRESVTVTRGHEIALSALGYACARAGQRAEALSILAQLEARPESARCDFARLAELYTALGDRDRALDHLERAVAEREHILVQLCVVPWYDDLRGHPRFQAILEQMGLDGRSSLGGEVLPGEAGRPSAPSLDRLARDAARARLPALHLPGRRRASILLGAALATGILAVVATRPEASARLPWQPDVGGTYFNPKRGLEGTAFLFDPVYDDAPRYLVTIRGPSGWNGDSTFECYPTLSPQVPAARRAICWTLSVPPVTGEFEGTSVVGRDTLRVRFRIDASSALGAPKVQDVSLGRDGIRVRWGAPPEAKSFMVRLSGLPFGGTLTESLVPGSARKATLPRPPLEHRRDYQVAVFAFGVDLTQPGLAPDQFNVSVHDWRVRYDSIASSLDRANPGDPVRR